MKILVQRSKIINISYYGNIGKAQNIENILKNFVKLDRNKYHLNICGDGSELNYLQNKYQVNNVHFYGWVNKKKLDSISIKTNYFILSLNNLGRQKYIIPSKFQTYLSYGKPLLFMGDKDVCDFIKNNNIGFGISDLTDNNIYQFLNNLYYNDSKSYLETQKSINNFYKKNYIAENIAKYFLTIIKTI